MAMDIVNRTPERIRQIVAQKRENVDMLCRILKAAPASLTQLATLSLTNFNTTIRRMMADRQFREGLLSAIKQGDFSPYKTLSPVPDEDLLNWAAARLVPEELHLRVRNAQSWDEFLLTLLATDGSLLKSVLAQDDRADIEAQFEQWKEANPDRSRPFIVEQPSVAAVRLFFCFFLGRPPNKSDAVDQRRRNGYPTLLRDLLRSMEFQRAFFAWLGEHKSPYVKLDGDDAAELSGILENLFGWDVPAEDGAGAPWDQLLRSIWFDDDRRKELLKLLARPDDCLDAFVCDVVETACSRSAADKQLLVAVVEKNQVQFVLNLAPGSAESPLKIRLKAHDAGVLEDGLIEGVTEGPQLLTQTFDPSHINEQFDRSISLEIETDDGRQSLPVKRRPLSSDATTVADKIAWHVTKGRFDNAQSLMFDLDIAGDDGLTFFMNRLVRVATGASSENSLANVTHPDWKGLAARLDTDESEARDISPAVRQWLSKDRSGQAFLIWLDGKGPGDDLLAGLVSLAHSDTPASDFDERCEALGSAQLVVSALTALAMSGAERSYLDAVGDKLQAYPKSAVRSALKQDIEPVATVAMICGSGRFDPEFAYQLGVTLGAAKHAEQVGAYGQALSLVSHVARARPDLESLLFAGTMENKYGSVAEAARFFAEASKARPDDFALLERFLTIERGLVMADPLRANTAFLNRARRLREQRVKELIRQPGNADRRVALANSLVIEGDDVSALEILEAALDAGDITPDGQKRLIDLSVKQNKNEEALRYCSDLPADDLSEWIVINQARALRALGRAEEAGELLDRTAADDWPSVSREAVRNLFFLAEFEQAAARGEALCSNQPEDIELRLICAAAYFELGQLDDAERHNDYARSLPKAVRFEEELDLFSYAISRKRGEADAVRHLNPMFERLGCSAIMAAGENAGDFDSFTLADDADSSSDIPHPPLTDGPLVSVIMTSFNSSAYIDTAINSILDQRYRNIELIIVDDHSTDETPDILRAWQKKDPRVRALLKSSNDGTYVSKNLGLLKARGTYVALQDSDDWSHPDRIGKSIAVLESRKDLMGLTTDWLRMTSKGELMIKAGGMISHVCCISLVFRRAPVIDAIGMFDSVRIEADMEFIKRIGLAFGHRSVARLRWPLLFGRVRSDSLTGNDEIGISRTGFSTPRLEYQAHRDAWHASIRAGASPFMAFPLTERNFKAPQIILPERVQEATGE